MVRWQGGVSVTRRGRKERWREDKTNARQAGAIATLGGTEGAIDLTAGCSWVLLPLKHKLLPLSQRKEEGTAEWSVRNPT